MRSAGPAEFGRGWGPFTGRQLTTIVCVAIVSIVAIPTAAIAATGAFTSTTATPAVKGVNSSQTANAIGVYGRASATGNVARRGVDGSATGSNGTGVYGTGTKYGLYSNGHLGVVTGKSLKCNGCIGSGALASSARTYCNGYPHTGIDWSIPGSTPGNGCNLFGANLAGANLEQSKLVNANLGSANLTGAFLHYANLTGAELSWANLTGAHVVLANLTGADLNDANLSGADLHFTVLTGADFTDADMTGVLWGNTTCPNGQSSEDHGDSCVGQGGGL